MTATYEPFTPAGSPEPRRGQDRYTDRYDDRYADDGLRRPEDPWAGQQQRSWEEPGPVWAETSFAEPRWAEPQTPPSSPAPAYAAPASPAPGYPAPSAPAPGYAAPGPASYPAPGYATTGYANPGYPPAEYPAAAYETPMAAPEPRGSRMSGLAVAGRAKPLIMVLVLLLLGVTGWQAYRIETMIKSSNDLASAVAGEQDRSAELEKALTNVFDPEGISSATLPSVFRVRAGDFTGTAFSVGTKAADGTANLFTNFHVVEELFKTGARTVTLERGSTRISATIIKVNQAKDLALLRAKQEIKPIAVAPGQVKPGQQVVVVGAPLGLDDTVTTGVISAFREDDSDGPTIQFDAPINPGNSGGPVVNTSKQVVGLATAKARDAEGIGLAIPIATACATFNVC
ncbi:S1C family serine protease [Actinoplanes awajinensis]|uniref:Serine protease n=1 Tax=Actinoplanes awajinensis subsp. mycoplanecinus TaxID=135947 RepID=A0A0X3UTF9_9ACTN|nr:trypsin-like peptidase domain-containing protein [Actinoplanes awajinensis]KUL35869.1 serine protease [Actinoplanes awajinensis subsp. mycoplanecinus]